MRKQSHIPALDGLRGLAVLMVFVYHYGGGMQSSVRAMRVFGMINKGGWCGVTLFFLLSGFLITGILWDSKGEPHWWRNFYARRTLRIFPLYYGTLVLVMVAAAVVGAFYQAASKIWIPALFLQNFPYLIEQVDHLGRHCRCFTSGVSRSRSSSICSGLFCCFGKRVCGQADGFVWPSS